MIDKLGICCCNKKLDFHGNIFDPGSIWYYRIYEHETPNMNRVDIHQSVKLYTGLDFIDGFYLVMKKVNFDKHFKIV